MSLTQPSMTGISRCRAELSPIYHKNQWNRTDSIVFFVRIGPILMIWSNDILVGRYKIDFNHFRRTCKCLAERFVFDRHRMNDAKLTSNLVLVRMIKNSNTEVFNFPWFITRLHQSRLKLPDEPCTILSEVGLPMKRLDGP